MTSRAYLFNKLADDAHLATEYEERHQAVHSQRYNQDTKENSHSQSSDALKSNSPADSLDNAAPLHVYVERAVRDYFAALGGDMPTDLYELILAQVELPLLTVVLEQTCGNQTKCAQILGLNRGTLRKKLKTYHLM